MNRIMDDGPEIWLCNACFDPANDECLVKKGRLLNVEVQPDSVESLIYHRGQGLIYVCRCTPDGRALH